MSTIKTTFQTIFEMFSSKIVWSRSFLSWKDRAW